MGWLPAYLNNLSTTNYGRWNHPPPPGFPNAPGEGGVDVGAPGGTPVLALASGPIIDMGCWKDSGHCVVTQRVNVPGQGPQDMYFQHIQIAPGLKVGDNLTRGQRIGTVNGTQAGVTYNETEIGFNANWGSPWGRNHPGPWVSDPRPWINALLTGNPPSGSPITQTSGASNGSNSGTSTAISPGPAWVSQLSGEGIKIGLFLLALVLVGFGFYLLFTKQINGMAKKGVNAAKTAAEVA